MGYHHYGRGMGMMGYNGFGIFMLVFFIILILVILFIGYKLIQSNKLENVQAKIIENNNALNILKERYAKGELSDEEFEHKKKILEE